MLRFDDPFRKSNRGRADVCFLVRALSGGGAQRDAIVLANGLRAAGIASAIATLDARGPLAALIGPDIPLFDLGKGQPLRMALAAPALARFLRAERPQAIISSEAAGNCLAVIASRLMRGHSRPAVILREVASPLAASRHDPYGQNRLAYHLAPWLYPRADLVTTFTQGARDELIAHFGLLSEKVVNLGTNAILTTAQLQTLVAAPDHRDPHLIVNIGRLSPEKDHGTLLQAFATLCQSRPVRLVIIGDGPDRPRLEQQACRLGVDRRVTFAGFVADPLPLLQRAALFVSSSRQEGLGNALIEALACGLPVVATDAPHGPREVLAGGRFGALVPVGDAAALADAMARTLGHCPSRQELQARAADFSVERATRRFVAILAAHDLLQPPFKPAQEKCDDPLC